MEPSTRDNYDRSLVVKAAWYYYISNLTQQQIADLLGISRMKVIRLIDEAKEQHIVEFKFPTVSVKKIDLEEALIKRYQLQDALVIPTATSASQTRAVASAAAMYLSDRIHGDAFINVGYGKTISKVLNELAAIAPNTVSFISLTGGVTPYLPANTTTRFNANLYIIPAPILMSNAQLAQALIQEPDIQNILKMNKQASYTVISIGGMNDEATALKEQLVDSPTFLNAKMAGAVGDILLHFIDKNGQVVLPQIKDRIIGIAIEQLQQFNNVIGVVTGQSKVAATKAALKGGYLDVLITDEATAKEVLKTEKK